MSLKDIESNNWEDCYDGLKMKIANVFGEHRKIMKLLESDEIEFYNNILFGRANKTDFMISIGKLTGWLEKFYNSKVILLIDEYDAPINDFTIMVILRKLYFS